MLNEKRTRSQAMKDHPHGSFGTERGRKKVRGKKRSKIYPKEKKATEGPQGTLPGPRPGQEVSHTVYHDMGYLMAESLGLVSETTKKDTYGGTGPDKMSRTPFKRPGGGPDSVDRARATHNAKVKRHSVGMIGADEEPTEVRLARQARQRGGTKARVEAARAVRYLQGPGSKTTIKPSNKKNLLRTPKPPKYR